MIEDLYFTFGSEPDLAKSSQIWLPHFLHLPGDDSHFDYKQFFLKIK